MHSASSAHPTPLSNPAPRRRPRRRTVSSLDAHLSYWLRYVSNQASQAFSRKVEEHGITVAEWVMLRALYERDQRPSTLADRLGLTRGAISKLTDRLVIKLMITQQSAGIRDQRAQMLALTDLGRATVPLLAGLADENDKQFFGDLDPRTREVIVSAMREIVRRRRLCAVPVD